MNRVTTAAITQPKFLDPSPQGHATCDHLPCLISLFSVFFMHCGYNQLLSAPALPQICSQVLISFAFTIPDFCIAFSPFCYLLQHPSDFEAFLSLYKSFSGLHTWFLFPHWGVHTRTITCPHLSTYFFMLLLLYLSAPDDKLISLEKWANTDQRLSPILSCLRILFFPSFKNTITIALRLISIIVSIICKALYELDISIPSPAALPLCSDTSATQALQCFQKLMLLCT